MLFICGLWQPMWYTSEHVSQQRRSPPVSHTSHTSLCSSSGKLWMVPRGELFARVRTESCTTLGVLFGVFIGTDTVAGSKSSAPDTSASRENHAKIECVCMYRNNASTQHHHRTADDHLITSTCTDTYLLPRYPGPQHSNHSY